MIPTKELRIGNVVDYLMEDGSYQSHPVFSINDITGKNFNPIPLTPNILIACGFEKHSNSNEFWNFWQLKNGWYIGEALHDEPSAGVKKTFCYWGDDYIEIGSLHKLQNLYFALTGKELPVNLK